MPRNLQLALELDRSRARLPKIRRRLNRLDWSLQEVRGVMGMRVER